MSGSEYRGRLRPPTRDELARYAEHQHLRLSPEELDAELAALSSLLDALAGLEEHDALPAPVRRPCREPDPQEDPYRAIVRFCRVEGAGHGPLLGLRVGVKDNIAVAGVPLTGGRRTDPPVVPAEDAVVVERLLGAGAVITAKTNLNGQSDFGVTRNPRDPRFWSGGSSSGSAAATAAGLVDAALGSDTGASIRMPAAWCGLVGMKPTHGLVPLHGLLLWDHTLDHIGPITRTVAENASLLEVIAGPDRREPSVTTGVPVAGYGGAAGLGVEGLRIGVVEEALESAGCTDDTLRGLERAEARLRDDGAVISRVSVPLWGDAAMAGWFGVMAEGLTGTDNALGRGWGYSGRADLAIVAASAAGHLSGDRELLFGGRTFPLAIEHLRHVYGGLPLARAHNLRLQLRDQLDGVLADVDLLMTPTVPDGPPLLPENEATAPAWTFEPAAWMSIVNTCPLNLTGHPALTVPAGRGADGMPVGVQLVGRHFDEATVYRAAYAVEAVGGRP